jgi:hypothetical protein
MAPDWWWKSGNGGSCGWPSVTHEGAIDLQELHPRKISPAGMLIPPGAPDRVSLP